MTTATLFAALSAITRPSHPEGTPVSACGSDHNSAGGNAVWGQRPAGDLSAGRRLGPKALLALGVDPKCKKAPCHATDHYVFRSISSDDLGVALGALVKVEGGLGPWRADRAEII